jgi:superfamily I DNA and/or RNA helicase
LLNDDKILNEIRDILSKIKSEMRKQFRESKESIGEILQNFCDELENNPRGLENTLLEYTQIIGTTAQGSAKESVFDKNDDTKIYDAVIIDEAARIIPLDLMIPLTKTKKFILVGDDNQLPHLLDPAIEKDKLFSNEEILEEYKKSLFSKLKETAKKRSLMDGLNRVAQLDTQYRMHPEIGDLISSVFYENKLKNGIDAENAKHNITRYIDKQFIWYDLPIALGEENYGKSKRRPIEAKRITQLLIELMLEHPKLSFGVITFYLNQRSEIINFLKAAGILESEEGFRLTQKYKGEAIENRLKVGTVDAFQGQEFDVVLLSLVRSNKIQLMQNDEKNLRQKFGFLSISNRQNVAFSRAKKLLIVFGDKKMFSIDELKDSELRGFYELAKKCEGEHGKTIQ